MGELYDFLSPRLSSYSRASAMSTPTSTSIVMSTPFGPHPDEIKTTKGLIKFLRKQVDLGPDDNGLRILSKEGTVGLA